MDFLDAMLDFAYTLSGGDDFWAGFWFFGQLLLLFWLGNALFRILDVRWKRVRQFFAPTKKPGKAPEDSGPSPAEQGCGCLVSLLLVVAPLLLLMVFLLSRLFPGLLPW